jgi:L-asparaginase
LDITASDLSIADVLKTVPEIPEVAIVYGYADTDEKSVNAFCVAGVKGIIFAGTDNGSVAKSCLASLDNTIKSGIVVVRSSRIPSGIVSKDKKYEDEHGFIAAKSLNPQKAKILLQLTLTKYSQKNTDPIQKLFYKY